MTARELAKQLGRSEASIVNRVRRLNLKSKYAWTNEEDNVLRKHYGSMSARELGEQLNRSTSAVKAQVHRLGLTSKSATQS